METKPVSASRTTTAHFVLPEDANPAGNVHGGVILRHIDSTAGVVAMRHARRNVVTASMDQVNFLEPVYVGEFVTYKASLNMVGTSSMEVGVRVEAENLLTGDVRHTATAYLTFVALDLNRRPIPVPKLHLETEDDERRYKEANIRRQMRLEELKRINA